MMMGKLERVLSWADEVEQEEEEEAHQIINEQKPNPFGSARPREVVLQERAARNHLGDSFASSDFSSADHKMSPMKENIPVAGWNVVDSEVSPNRSPGLTAPPLKYPPRAYLPFLYQYQIHHQIGPKKLEEVSCEAAGIKRINAMGRQNKVSSMADMGKQGKVRSGERRRQPEEDNGGDYYGDSNNNRERDEIEVGFDMGMVKKSANGNCKSRGAMMNTRTYYGNANRGRR